MILHPLSLLFIAACYFLPFLSAFVPLLAFVAFGAAFFAARARLRSFTLFVLLVLLLVFAINYATFARFRVPACVSVVKLNKCNKKAPFAPCGVVCSRNTQTKNTKHKQRTQKQLAPSLPCAVPCFTVHPLSLNFDYFFSPNRERPCAPSVPRFLWFAVGLCVSRRAPSRLSATGLAFSPLRSLTPRGSLISSHKRAPRVSYTNRFCGLAFAWFVFCFPLFRKVCRLSPFLLSRCPCVFRVSFAPFCRFHVCQSCAPSGLWWVSLSVSVSRWFLLCPPCFLFLVSSVSVFAVSFVPCVSQ